jgi:hypothetical protein
MVKVRSRCTSSLAHNDVDGQDHTHSAAAAAAGIHEAVEITGGIS